MFLIAICFVFSLVYIYFEYCYKYWLWRGVPTIPTTFPFGNVKDNLFNRKFIGMLHKEFYDYFKKKGYKHGGVYMINDPAYLAIDPDIIKLILIKDFQHFTSRSISIDDEAEPLAANLLNLDGPKWKFLRAKLTPTFTSGKMKMMFANIIVCANEMKQVLDEMVDGSKGVDMKDILARFTTDVIGSCAFGIECNSLKNPNVKFREYGLKMFRRSMFDFVKRIIMIIPIGQFLHRKGLIKLSSKSEVSAFFSDLTNEIVNYRQNNNIERNDFLQLLIQMKNSGTEKDDKKLSMDQITAQAILFFAAGFETSSSTMNFAIFELAQNKDIQQRLRNEINANMNENNNQLTYESVMTMPYLDQVVSETLRKYPIASSIMRKCTQNYQIPNSSIEIEKGTPVIIPIYGLHHDPEYFSQPHIFDPERFSDECKKERKSCVYLPFGDGPRNCIGLRFGLMQTKIGIATILRNFEVSLNDRTILPLTMNNRSLILSPKHTIWINLRKIQH